MQTSNSREKRAAHHHLMLNGQEEAAAQRRLMPKNTKTKIEKKLKTHFNESIFR
jgi:hypothetical protein